MSIVSTAPTGPIVVGVDGSPPARRALVFACREALRLHRPLHLLHTHDTVVPDGGAGALTALGSSDFTALEHAAQQILDHAVATARKLTAGADVTGAVADGSAAAALVELSRSAHLVVVGARGRGALAGACLGSVSTQVSMHAHSPVVVVKDLPVEPDLADLGDPSRAGAVVTVGIDGSHASQACLAFAFEQASTRRARLDVVHAWPFERSQGVAAVVDAVSPRHEVEPQHRQLLEDSMAGWSQKYPDVDVDVSVVKGSAVTAILDHSDGAELVVVGSRGRGGFAGLLLGSVSHSVLQRATCPVAVVRGLR